MESGKCPTAEVGGANVAVVPPVEDSVIKALLSSLFLETSHFPATPSSESQDTATIPASGIEVGFQWAGKKRCFLHNLRKKPHNW